MMKTTTYHSLSPTVQVWRFHHLQPGTSLSCGGSSEYSYRKSITNRTSFLATAAVLLCTCLLPAQDKIQNIKLTPKYVPKETVYLRDKGFIIRFSKPDPFKKNEYEFHYYDTKANLIWKKATRFMYKPDYAYTIASPTGNSVYFVEFNMDILSKPFYVTQFAGEGEPKQFKLEGNKGYGESLQYIFCDDDNLYLLVTAEGEELHKKKKAAEQLILNRFSRKDMAWSKHIFKLPPIKDLEYASYWHFLGQSGKDKYLVSKYVNYETNEMQADLLVFDEQANITRRMTLKPEVKERHVRPAYSPHMPSYGEMEVTNHGFGSIISYPTRTPGNTSNGQFGVMSSSPGPAQPAAFNHWQLDATHKCLYTYGLLGQKPYKKLGALYDGFYVQKYDLQGNKIWEVQRTGVEELVEVKKFNVHASPVQREIHLAVLPGESLNFSIYTWRNLFTYEISATGELVNSRKTAKTWKKIGPVLSENYTTKTSEVIEKSGDTLYKMSMHFLTPDGEIVIATDFEKNDMNLYYFKL